LDEGICIFSSQPDRSVVGLSTTCSASKAGMRRGIIMHHEELHEGFAVRMFLISASLPAFIPPISQGFPFVRKGVSSARQLRMFASSGRDQRPYYQAYTKIRSITRAITSVWTPVAACGMYEPERWQRKRRPSRAASRAQIAPIPFCLCRQTALRSQIGESPYHHGSCTDMQPRACRSMHRRPFLSRTFWEPQ
jgi:hypothetical protein